MKHYYTETLRKFEVDDSLSFYEMPYSAQGDCSDNGTWNITAERFTDWKNRRSGLFNQMFWDRYRIMISNRI